MIFTSLHFLIFLPVVLLVYFTIPAKNRWMLLLLASYVFYAGWKLAYLPLILTSTVVDYFVALRISKTQIKLRRKLLLALSLLSNFGMLILFKYFHFLIGGAGWFKTLAAENDSVLWLQFLFEYGIPVGISFYTFQTVSYTLDVYHNRIQPEKNIGKFALFVTFFPQLVAGPIERFSHLHPQLFQTGKALWTNFRSGIQIMLVGFFLKMVIGDNLGEIIEPIFNSPLDFSLIVRWLSVVLFAVQIYADFNGYSLIAVGCARMMGIELMDNFKQPYRSLSIREFWTRWHISLSTWFRDYVYLPLGGSKSSKFRWFMAVLITFFLSGLWHGASVNFIYWGLLHGVFYLIEKSLFPIQKGKTLSVIEKSIRWTVTMMVVLFGWLLFRVNRMSNVAEFFTSGNSKHTDFTFNLGLILPLLFFVLLDFVLYKTNIPTFFDKKPFGIRWALYGLCFALILLFSNTGELPFIYFQF